MKALEVFLRAVDTVKPYAPEKVLLAVGDSELEHARRVAERLGFEALPLAVARRLGVSHVKPITWQGTASVKDLKRHRVLKAKLLAALVDGRSSKGLAAYYDAFSLFKRVNSYGRTFALFLLPQQSAPVSVRASCYAWLNAVVERRVCDTLVLVSEGALTRAAMVDIAGRLLDGYELAEEITRILLDQEEGIAKVAAEYRDEVAAWEVCALPAAPIPVYGSLSNALAVAGQLHFLNPPILRPRVVAALIELAPGLRIDRRRAQSEVELWSVKVFSKVREVRTFVRENSEGRASRAAIAILLSIDEEDLEEWAKWMKAAYEEEVARLKAAEVS